MELLIRRLLKNSYQICPQLKDNELPIFVNPPNKWAKCAYLQLETHFGWDYLNAISEALTFKKWLNYLA